MIVSSSALRIAGAARSRSSLVCKSCRDALHSRYDCFAPRYACIDMLILQIHTLLLYTFLEGMAEKCLWTPFIEL